VVVSTDAVAGRTFTGRVARVAPVLGDDSVQARVEAEILNADLLLKPGMFIRARIEFARRDNAPVIPENAFVKRGEQQGVFLADPQEKKARFVAAAKGIVEGDLAEILTPAQPVEHRLIVTAGQHLLEDGSPIVLPDEKPAAAPAPKEPAPAGQKKAGGG
jgi:multidrug efflux pump subunit AcrA (membrane-fusion protein)